MSDPTINNIETMTDEQLYDYMSKLNNKLAMVSRLPNGSGAVEQLQRMIKMASAHLQERALATSFKQMIAGRPAEIVTDPDLAPKEDTSRKPARNKMPINRVQVKRTDRPTSAIDLAPTPPDKDDSK
jgi:hypothetical protein